MRSPYLVVLVVTLITAGTYWYQSTAAVCPVPIMYRVGDIDPSFSLTKEQALQYAAAAEAVWEEEVGRELFIYDESAALPIQFIYDERQETADTESVERRALDSKWEESEKVRIAVEQLQVEHSELAKTYADKTTVYEMRLQTYNDEVNRYNDRGGAPAEVFGRLESEREKLDAEAKELNLFATKLNALVTDINALAEQGRGLVDAYNRDVAAYNKQFGFSYEFTQGDYQGDSINVYKFSSDEEVVAVLAHEFGHALGIGHVEGSSSLMYYLLENNDKTPILSSSDLQSYEGVCGYTETFQQKVRRIIRDF